MPLEFGDTVTCLMAAGGGYGDPLLRDPMAVSQDVRYGYVSVQGARNDYGVVIDPDNLNVDFTRTEELRRKLQGDDK